MTHLNAPIQLKTPNKGISGQTTGRELLDPVILSTEILNTYIRRNEILEHQGHTTTSTASTTLAWDPTEVLGVENLKRWNPSFWIVDPAEQAGFCLETRSPSSSRRPALQRSSTVELISYVRERLDVPFAQRLAKRLDYLVETSQEEYPHQAPMVPQSLQDFIDYLQSVPNLTYPNVVLTPNGNIRAEWHKARNNHFAVEFIGDGDVRFVVFAPDLKHPEKTTRVSGLTSTDSLMPAVQPYGVLDWASEPAMAA
jgi:hypothetical protein